MGYLWRGIWFVLDGVNAVLDLMFPIGFTLAMVGSGFALGYLYRFLFAEPGNKELLLVRSSECEVRSEKAEEELYERMYQ